MIYGRFFEAKSHFVPIGQTTWPPLIILVSGWLKVDTFSQKLYHLSLSTNYICEVLFLNLVLVVNDIAAMGNCCFRNHNLA
jgi:hypothetical protein